MTYARCWAERWMLPPRCRFVAVLSDLVLSSLPLRLPDIGVARLCLLSLCACLPLLEISFFAALALAYSVAMVSPPGCCLGSSSNCKSSKWTR